MHLNGIVKGNRVELEKDLGLPVGTPVTVQLEAHPLSLEQRRQAIMDSCGAWTDESLDAIFAEIIASRSSHPPRSVDLDAPP